MQGRVSFFARALTLAVLVMVAAASAARADTLTVTGTGEDDGPCAAGACPSIRSALSQAATLPGQDTIEVPAGDYFLSSALTVGSDVTLRGANARATIVHGGDDYRVFEVAAGVTATISHLTMRDGTATPANNYFGGNLTSAGNLTLDHVHVTKGSGYSAGGLANRGGTMTVQNSLLDQNSALNGGGDAGAILNFGGDGPAATLVVRDSTIAFNSARLTGGILEYGNPGDSTTLTRVTSRTTSPATAAAERLRATRRSTSAARSSPRTSRRSRRPTAARASPTTDGNLESGTECGFEVQNDSGLVSDAVVDMGGETDVMAAGSSRAWLDFAGACTGTDQRDVPPAARRVRACELTPARRRLRPVRPDEPAQRPVHLQQAHAGGRHVRVPAGHAARQRELPACQSPSSTRAWTTAATGSSCRRSTTSSRRSAPPPCAPSPSTPSRPPRR